MMPNLLAFVDELEKIAGIGSAALTTGAVGAGLGGLVGYNTVDGSTTDKLRAAGKGALIGGAGAATLGTGVAAASRAARGWHNPAVLSGENPTGYFKSLDARLGNVGERQLHALTGYVPKGREHGEYVRSIGIGGGYDQGAGAAAAAKQHLTDVTNGQDTGYLAALSVPKRLRMLNARWDAHAAQKAHSSASTMIDNKMTSLPGLVRAAANPNMAMAGAVKDDLLYGGGAVGTAMLAAGAHDLYKGVRGDVQPGQEGMGYHQRLGDSFGRFAGSLVPSPLPMVGQAIAGQTLSSTFGTVGKGLDRLRGTRAPVHDPSDPVTSTASQLGGHETVLSPSAAGKSHGSGFE
jgi:hypothetical protein